jgi:asparagine synthase (glutamine-hydrolysing)
MCGIAGLWQRDGGPVEPKALQRFTRSLANRGPDGEGFSFSDRGEFGLGHRRLAILDLSPAGAQPMCYADGRYWITFNGEIYNFLELRRELEALGHLFRSQTDTEVILAAYSQWGPNCQFRFNGMWAFAIWDTAAETLFLSRDRFGIKPLCYLDASGRFAFASELKAFRHLDDFEAQIDEATLRRALVDSFSIEGTEHSLIRGVRRLLGGHCMLVSRDSTKVWRWWNTLDHLSAPPATLDQQAERFRELFFDACRLRLRSDVPVATCLSGGLDSSAILCTLAELATEGPADQRRAPDWQRAFVATFPGTPTDERAYAELAVQHAAARATYLPISPDTTIEVLHRMVYDFEEIYNGIPSGAWSIYRELRRAGVVVSLDGHGSDELLGGYDWYAFAALRASAGLLAAPRRTLDLVNTLSQMSPADPAVRIPRRLGLMVAGDPLLRATVGALHSRFAGNGIAGGNSAAAWTDAAPLACALDPSEERAIDELGALNALLYREFHRTVLPTILRNFDRCSMAHGIEVRMPFMDWRLVCFSFSLPEASKIGGGYTKRILREAMRQTLPPAIRTRRTKIGFTSPLPTWFEGPLASWIWETVNRPDFLNNPLWDGAMIRQFVSERRSTNRWNWTESERIWKFVHAQMLLDSFSNKVAI